MAMTGLRAMASGALALLAAVSIGVPALAAADQPIAFKPAVARIIENVIVPSYEGLVSAAEAERQAMTALCEAPSPEALAAARAGFADLVVAFAKVEPYRFGPAREDNRFERLFFWPDRRSIGLRQVQGLLVEEDPTAFQVDTLHDKSVAMQGLLALDYVLAGTGADDLATAPAGYRCRYGAAIAGAILRSSGEILEGWTGPNGYGALMLDAGPDNPIYRSHGEVMQAFLQAGREQLQIVGDMKIAAVIGDTPDKAKPKIAPFWRSGLVIPSLDANLQAVLMLQNEGGLAELLPDNEAYNANSLAFQIGEARRVLAELEATGTPWVELVEEPAAHEQLGYVQIPINGALKILAERYPAALGLILGFNSLDGD